MSVSFDVHDRRGLVVCSSIESAIGAALRDVQRITKITQHNSETIVHGANGRRVRIVAIIEDNTTMGKTR